MKLPRLIVLASLPLGSFAAGYAADATAPVDLAQRNTPFAPGATVSPDKRSPQLDEAVQGRRVETTVLDKKSSALGDRRAAIDVQETRDKTVLEKNSHRPEARELTMSAFNHREASLATGAETRKPELVTRYQDSLTAASASNLARLPALGRATATKINRFVFRKNPPDAAAALEGAPVTPAAGGSAVPR